MSKYFSGIEIKREDADEVDRALKGAFVDEEVIKDTAPSIPEDKFEEFVDNTRKRFSTLNEASQLSESLLIFHEMMSDDALRESPEAYVHRFDDNNVIDNELSSLYGYVSLNQDYRGNIAVVYAVHIFRAKMADQERKPVKLGIKHIEQIKRQYFKYRTLKAFKKNGLLEEIKYI